METTTDTGSVWPLLLGLLAVAVAAVFVARFLHQRSRRRQTTTPPPPVVHAELDRATQLRTILPDEEVVLPPPPEPSVAPVTDARASAIVQEELARPSPGQQTSDEAAATQIVEEAAAHSATSALALASLPVEALPAFGDNIIVARGAGPQLLLATAREILDGQAEEADAPDFPDPLVRALDGGGACMSLPGGAGAEAALFIVDCLAQPQQGEPIYAEAWVTIRQDDVFLSVPEAEANAALETAMASAEQLFPDEGDVRFGQHVTAAVSTALEARGLPFGARLYAFHPGAPEQAEARISLTDDANGGYVGQWESLAQPRLLPVEQVRRAWRELPDDVRETLGLE